MFNPETDRLHPGLHIALARSKMDEAQLARAMACGELASPQRYGNSWFFNLRITGLGKAFRFGLDEHVWRDPNLYLNQGFLDRCNGLPVILNHPETSVLNADEYTKRNVGYVLYPYILESATGVSRPNATAPDPSDEVWGIARILNERAAEFMRSHVLSTSPAVSFRPTDGNEKIELEDGKHLLIEGKPSLIDHLAVCEEGVWDKGGLPAGVDVTAETEAEAMAEDNTEDRRDEEEKNERDDTARRDEKLDRLLDGIKTISDRQDAIDKRLDEMNGDEKKEEEKKDEAEEDKKEEEKKDASSEEEAKQAKELHELAKEEEDEATEKAKEEARGDAAKKDDDDEEDKKMPWDKADRKDGESDASYSRRMDALAKDNDPSFVKREDESVAAHCDRVSGAGRKDRARRDRDARLGRVDKIDAVLDKLVGTVEKIASRQDSLETRLLEQRAPEDEVALSGAQSRADSVFQAFGDSAPRPMAGESVVAYRLRVARALQKHSTAWKDTDLAAMARYDSASFDRVEGLVYADAATAARTPTGIPVGQLREIKIKRPGGGEISEFHGEPISWMSTYMAPARACTLLSARPIHRQ